MLLCFSDKVTGVRFQLTALLALISSKAITVPCSPEHTYLRRHVEIIILIQLNYS